MSKEGAMKWLVLFVGTLAVFSLADADPGRWDYNALERSYNYTDFMGNLKMSATYDALNGWQFKTPTCEDNTANPFTEGEYPSALQGLQRGYESALRQKRYNRASEQLELARLLSMLDTRPKDEFDDVRARLRAKLGKRAKMVCLEERPYFRWNVPDPEEEPGTLEKLGLRAAQNVRSKWLVNGALENRGDAPARNVWVYVTVYDTMGNLVEVQTGMGMPLVVPPGDTAHFIVFGSYPTTLKWSWRANWD